MYNCPEMLEALYASFKLGCAVVPINFRLHPKEFSFIIDHAGVRAVIASAEFNEALAQRREQMPEARHLITTAETTGELLDYETLLAAEVGGREDADVEPEGPAWLFYTSGTTGEPKGVILTHRNLLAMSMGFCADNLPGLARKGRHTACGAPFTWQRPVGASQHCHGGLFMHFRRAAIADRRGVRSGQSVLRGGGGSGRGRASGCPDRGCERARAGNHPGGNAFGSIVFASRHGG